MCIEFQQVCDLTDDCGDSSDELTDYCDDNRYIRNSFEEEDKPLVSSSIDEVFQRPVKSAPEGIFFKKRMRTEFEIDQSKSYEEESSKSELDELFPTPKFGKFKSNIQWCGGLIFSKA